MWFTCKCCCLSFVIFIKLKQYFVIVGSFSLVSHFLLLLFYFFFTHTLSILHNHRMPDTFCKIGLIADSVDWTSSNSKVQWQKILLVIVYKSVCLLFLKLLFIFFNLRLSYYQYVLAWSQKLELHININRLLRNCLNCVTVC